MSGACRKQTPTIRGGWGRPGVEKSIYRYILHHSKPQQIVLTLLAAASFPFLWLFYELPKKIINEAIQAENTDFPVELAWFEFSQIDFLFVLCGLFLLLVVVNQAFKYAINVYRGKSGERLLRRFRFDLYSRVLRFPLPVFRRKSPGEFIQMITAEVEPLGGFIGEAFSLPVFQGGQLLVILAFLLAQNWIMAVAAVALYPLQFYIIPKLQRKVNSFGKERVRLVRRLSEQIGETIAGIQEIHVHDSAAFERAEFSRRLGGIYDVRLKIYVWKFVMKFLNNAINQLGPFCFYSIGGYLVIDGDLQIGTLMAAIAAHKDLAAPWKELLNYYQRREDARIKYEQVMNQFEPPGMLDEALQLDEPETIGPLTGEVAGSSVGLEDDTGTVLVDGASFVFDAAKRVAVVGGGGSGKEELSILLARLQMPSSGAVTIGGARLTEMPEAVTGRRITYVGANAHMFATNVRDNLYYGLKHRPLGARDYHGEDEVRHHQWVREADASGNSTDDINADWIDYTAAGAADAAELTKRSFEVLRLVGMDGDLYDLGLRGAVDMATRSGRAEQFLKARAAFRERLADPDIAALVETFDAERYNDNATLAENLLFGTPVGDAFDMDRLAENSYVLEVVEKTGLTEELLDAGQQVASLMVELFADLPAGHPFFEQYSFISSDDLPEFQAILGRIGRDGGNALSTGERTMLLSLPFRIVPARHRLDVITDNMKARVLEARRAFADDLPETLAGSVEFFDAGRYNAAATLQDNILFGKLAYGQARGVERVGALISEVVDALDLRPAVMEVGLDFQVGIGGARLSGSQRQKLAIARAVLKRPDILILNEATAALDSASQASLLEGLLEEFKGRGLIWALHRAGLARHFDRVLVMRSGKIAQQGTFDELDREGSDLRELLEAE